MQFLFWILIAEAVVIVTVNVVTIVIFTSTPRLRCRKYCLIVNLAVADLFVGLVTVPIYTYSVIVWRWNNIKLYYSLDTFLSAASLFGLAVVAIERVYAAYYPFKHRTLGTVRYGVGISIAWAFALVFSMCQYLTSRYLPYSVMSSIYPIVRIFIPISIVMISYCLIWIKMAFKRDIPNHANHQSNKKLTVTLAIVTLISFVAWMPFMCIMVYLNLCRYINCPYSVNSLSSTLVNIIASLKCLHYGNSFVNFIVYVVRMRDFKVEILRRMRCRQNQVHHQNRVIQQQNIATRNRPGVDGTVDTKL